MYASDIGLQEKNSNENVSDGRENNSGLKNAVGKSIIKANRTSLKGEPNSITQVVHQKGGIDRNYYDRYGRQSKQISNNDHGHKEESKLGKHGEHAHDYTFNSKGELERSKARELTSVERKENEDFL